jgi:hypothetical protein
MVHDILQPCRPARPGGENNLAEPLSKIRRRQFDTSQTAWDHPKAYLLAGAGQVRTLFVYRLWIGRDVTPHKGHPAMPLFDLAAKIIESHESLTVSTTKPLGTREEIQMPVFMALILPLRTASSSVNIIRWESAPLWMPTAIEQNSHSPADF